ncbi:MAG: STAS domain-containing protein [Actinomycetota bacterium]|nr:STAS domain-containing protein [Actinomycetota bacterium]
MTGFEIQVVDSGQVCHLTIAGEVDLSVCAELTAVGLECLDRAGTTVALDLAQVTFIDSTGIGALVTVRNRAEDTGKRLQVSRVSDRVAKVLTMAGMAELFGLGTAETTVIAPSSAATDASDETTVAVSQAPSVATSADASASGSVNA